MATRNLFTGLVVGGLIGAAFSILYAPKSGKETRADIRKSADELYDNTKVQCHRAIKEIDKLVDR